MIEPPEVEAVAGDVAAEGVVAGHELLVRQRIEGRLGAGQAQRLELGRVAHRFAA
jgi:hypothetical protein